DERIERTRRNCRINDVCGPCEGRGKQGCDHPNAGDGRTNSKVHQIFSVSYCDGAAEMSSEAQEQDLAALYIG
ncbi:hypothetical protein, partial [Bradyrhizobium sp.]|uniref:hypothetical protein n=1 Tax=Bradyrhizobium sp. TaxID=376 RepID=UPI002724AD53